MKYAYQHSTRGSHRVSRDMVKLGTVLENVTNKLRKSMNKPVKDFKEKGVSVAVWETRNGGYSISISKRYKDKVSNEWKESKYWFKEDLGNLIIMLQGALDFCGGAEVHKAEGVTSGQGQVGKPATYELSQNEIDDLPF
jgi:hypothetical protein